MKKSAATVALVVALVSWATPAEAYLDPGSGSMLLQVLLGGAAALAVALRLAWQRISGALRRRATDKAS